MNYLNVLRGRQRQAGMAAVEMALVLPFLVVILTLTLYFGRYFWHYTVAHKAARDAARYLSSISIAEMTTRKTPIAEIDASLFAKTIAQMETEELSPGPGGLLIEIYCDTGLCKGGLTPPEKVRAMITIDLSDTIFPGFTTQYIDPNLGYYTVEVVMPYVGH